MHPQLQELHQDHLNLEKVLRLLEKKLTDVRGGEHIDLSVLSEIVDYVQSYPDLVHHKHENVIFMVYLEHPSCKNDLVQRLLEEHTLLRNKTQELRKDIEQWCLDSPMLRERVVDKISDYLNLQWDHLNLEEGSIFTLLNEELTANDWERIEASLSHTADPLFCNLMRKRFEHISDQLCG